MDRVSSKYLMDVIIKIVTEKSRKYLYAVILFLVSIIFVFIYSLSTSPLYPNYYGTDSSVFQIMGKYWNSGLVPYRDLIDDKGPYGLLIDRLGYLLSGNRYGIAIFQMINIFFMLIGFFKIASIYVGKRKKCLSYTLIALGFFTYTYLFNEGNICEEWVLPYLSFSIYFQSKWFNDFHNNKLNHPPCYAFFYGITFAVGFLTCLRNVIQLATAVLCITIILSINKMWTNLLKNAIAFLTGTLITILPWILYFLANNCIENFWYYNFFYNLKYAQINYGTVFDMKYSIKGTTLFFINWLSVLSLIPVGIV